MLLDTNFLLSYMESLTLYPQVKDFFVRNFGFVTYFTAQRDIFLLENQIPLWVLKMLATLKYGDYDQDGNLQKELFGKFCGSAVFCDYQPTKVRGSCDGKNSEDEQPMHLLETLRDVFISEPIQPKTLQQKDFKTESKSHIYPFRSVRDLKQKGIFFRSSSINSIHGIKFKSYKLFGKLDLPKEHMNIYSKVIYSNMIAYEMSPNTNTRYEVSSYVNFMKSLIVCPEDVKELREKGVICNHLGTDEEAAKLFQDITTYDVVSHGGILVDVIKDIQSHVSCKAKTSMAECYWTYFSTPWSIIALLVAAALLCLTIMQTHYTMYPMN
ncbi:putative UPF0481 protein At3g02645 [Nicotiana tabacum]|uniref:UPF0481 protein At3g02645 n=1 Tax=Nicotiana tabacum TaxID=4097 RepID=A0A1S4DB44_TOBAC|nr:PREDICTED: putative UPF0481 protein At3g02645 isoform X1 [Nicotiana tabacum]